MVFSKKGEVEGNPSKTWERYYSLGITLFVCICAYLVQYRKLSFLPEEFQGIYGVLRLSMGLFLFYIFLMGILTTLDYDMQYTFQTEFFGIKILMLAGIIALMYFLPESVLKIYTWISIVFSFLFLILSLMYIIDLSYRLTEKIMEDDVDDECTKQKGVFIFFSSLVAIISICALIYLWKIFCSPAVCAGNQTFFICVVVLNIVVIIITIFSQSGNFLSGCLVFGYTCYLLFSAYGSDPDLQCNVHYANRTTLSMTISAIFSLFTIAYSSFSVSSNAGLDLNDYFSLSSEEKGEKSLDYVPTIFNFIMAMGAAYIAALCTGWNFTDDSEVIGIGNFSYGVKIVSIFLCLALYVWTLFAAKVCGDERDW
eukprot:TRINITY_DN2635_c0_g1_i1.p1 TRINITY_DN2635_c0_g1~~TRINITY_DN2635_c0_g1_i1.p1  ORF type:complete len:368 (+),score=86.25 TRINITY_DN2635_c0_g1_i1:1197-2300(+)